MIITCPSCDAQYLLPDNAIGEKGRRVKCTTCDYTWIQAPETEEPEQSHEIAEEFADQVELVTAAQDSDDDFSINMDEFLSQIDSISKAGSTRILIDGLMYALCALIITGIGLVSFSDKIVAAWPESALFYETLQIPVTPPGQGLEFQEMKIATTATEAETGDVAISGKLINKSQSFIRLPKLRVRATTQKDEWLKDWTINLDNQVLSAGKEATLDYVLQDAPAGTANIHLIFID